MIAVNDTGRRATPGLAFMVVLALFSLFWLAQDLSEISEGSAFTTVDWVRVACLGVGLVVGLAGVVQWCVLRRRGRPSPLTSSEP